MSIQEFEAGLPGLGSVGSPYPGDAGSDEAFRFGGQKESYGLARRQSGFGLHPQTIRREVNGCAEAFCFVSFQHNGYSHLHPLAL